MKKKAVIIIIACVVVLAGIVLAYFTLPISYAGTSKRQKASLFDRDKIILPTEAQASQLKSGMTYEEILDTIGLPQKDYGSGICIYEFYLRDGHRLWIYTPGFYAGEVQHSDYPYQTHGDYLKKRREEKDSAFAVTPWNNMYGTAANSLTDAA